MFWFPQLKNQTDSKKEEIVRMMYGYEVKTETYEKPKRKRFYKNYISRRKNEIFNIRKFISKEENIKIEDVEGEFMSPDTFSNIVAINIYFEALSKKEQKQCIEYLKSLDIDTTDLEMKMK